jgi:hypothetical protein
MAEGEEYRFVGTHADTLVSGQPVEPGEFVYLDEEAVKGNQAMIDDELLVATEQPAEEDIVAETKGTAKSRAKKES